MNKILTIIIPSYNISRYIDSVLPHYLYEPLFNKVKLLFIDDGATDDTVNKLSEFVKKYPEYISIVQKNNGGHGSVINFGVKLVQTKYFKVIDGDDWVNPIELNKLCDRLFSCNDDIIVSDFVYEFSDRKTISYGINDKSGFKYKIHLHNVTYKTSLWIENNISVREKVFYEDSQYCLYPLQFAKKISYFKAEIYHYRCDNPNQSVNATQQLKHKDEYVLVAEDLCRFISAKHNIPMETKQYILQNVVRIVFGAYEICTSKLLSFSESVVLCKDLDSKFKKFPLVFSQMKKTYKKYRYLKFLNYFGLKMYLKRN